MTRLLRLISTQQSDRDELIILGRWTVTGRDFYGFTYEWTRAWFAWARHR